MPTNDTQWLWFAFYTGGALLAWLWFLVVAGEALTMVAMRWKHRRDIENIMNKRNDQ